MIPIFRPAFGDEEVDAVAEVLRSGWIGLGPKTKQFEEEFAKFAAVPHAIGMNSCTAALDIAVRLLDIGLGDEVIVPTMTFVSTAHVVAYNLGTPVFADVDPITLNIDPEDVARKITRRTKAIVVVHHSGRPVDLDGIRAVAKDIPVIEDCAHAAGSHYRGQPVGGLGDIGCFSFQAVKNLATGDGGMVTTKNDQWAKRAMSLRWLGIDRSTWDRTDLDRSYRWNYNLEEIGLKCHMNDIAAALGLVQLRRLKDMNDKRHDIVRRYQAGLANIDQIDLPADDDETFRSSWHMFCIRCDRRDDLSSELESHGIASGVHYTPIHLYDCYGNRPVLPVAEAQYPRLLTLPLYPTLEDADVDRIIQVIRDFHKAG
ncbi:MAG: DegT/DnrJ/EryC1/StrS family aminotransferase [Qingshengfaniella sp.]